MLGSEGAETSVLKFQREAQRAQEQGYGRGGKKEEKESFPEYCDLDTASVSQLREFWEHVVVDKGVGVGVGGLWRRRFEFCVWRFGKRCVS